MAIIMMRRFKFRAAMSDGVVWEKYDKILLKK